MSVPVHSLDQYYDPARKLSQRTLVAMWQALESASHDFRNDMLYAHDFPEWFVTHAEAYYGFNWQRIVRDLRSANFFYPGYSDHSRSNITGSFLDRRDAGVQGEQLLQRLAALLATTLVRSQYGGLVRRQLELDGYCVDANYLRLVPLEGQVSEAEEEELLTRLIRQAGFPIEATILKHLADARENYLAGNQDHSSLNESRSFIQALIDDITNETGRSGGHSVGVPGGTANRIQYLRDVGFFATDDEKSAFTSAWGMLSAGSHPGVPPRHEARIGLILALEFGHLLVLKFQDWKKNHCKRFSAP